MSDTKFSWTVSVTKPFSPAAARYVTFFVVSMRCYAQHIDTTFPEHAGIRLTLKQCCSAV
jgi:hypothetical protein